MSTDEEAWAAAMAGEGEAFGLIFDRHRARVYRHSLGLAPSWADADDVVAVVFLEAWRKRDRVHFVGGSLLPWLLKTATFTAKNLTRASTRYRAALRRLPVGEHHADHADSIGDGDALTALRDLSQTDQQVLTLCVLEGISQEDAARVLGVRVGTVKSRLSRAKSRLRDVVGNQPAGIRQEGVSDVL
ncbi:sigma-70 family RNA polymerase sigma factor [Microbacterium sp. NPDC076911]|uniref:RNA polymerase sigma factor n=1 Tax=Microbacterium sp. NPDC076911 TaxID=3154958 RepID=UPI0034269FF4